MGHDISSTQDHPELASVQPSERNPLFRLTDAITAGVLRAGTAARAARIFHPEGVAHFATVTVSAPDDTGRQPLGVPLLDRPGRHRAVVRLSRGASVPEPLPDVLGLAVRVIDAHGPGRHQDILVGSSLAPPVARQLLLPAFGVGGATLSSVLPYRLGSAGTFLLGADLRSGAGRALVHLAAIQDAIETGELALTLRYAPRFGSWTPFAEVEVGERLPDADSRALSFNVDDHTGGGIAPQGWWQALRRHAYAASQTASGR